MFTFATLALAVCFSAVLPFAILSLRETVRGQRQWIILDLQTMFGLGKDRGHQEEIVPSFEFVKYKYFGCTQADPGTDTGGARRAGRKEPLLAFLLCSLPLVLLVFAFSVLAISVVLKTVLAPERDLLLLPHFLHLFDKNEHTVLWVFVVAFLGGYLFAVRSLLRAVNNFDLNPGSFIGAALQLLFGVVTAVIIVVGGLGSFMPQAASNAGIAVPASILAAFAIGFIPEFGMRILYRASQLWLYKREDTELYKSFQATPVEVIDGIDTEIRSRLADFNIFTVQNLATANPIMLFVETPYGIYQSIDWVAQAQLCASVGPHAVLKLWRLGIRTIFDLERAVLGGPGYSTPALRQAIGLALLTDAPEEMRKRLLKPDGSGLDDDSIAALVDNKLDDLHVHRLRQITNRIEDRLGHENKRFGSRLSWLKRASEALAPLEPV